MASKYEGEYVKVEPDPTLWLVEGGKRIKLNKMTDWYEAGLRKLHKITEEELEAIPYSHDWGQSPPPDRQREADDESEDSLDLPL